MLTMASQPDIVRLPKPKRTNSLRRLEQKLRPHVPSLAAVGDSISSRRASLSYGRPPPPPSSSSSPVVTSESPGEAGHYRSLLRKRTVRKMPKTNNLSINVPGVASPQQPDASARSGLASPRTPSNKGTTEKNNNKAQFGEGYENHIHSPINALPPPPSPRSPKPGSKTAKLFGNKLASKSATKLNNKSHPDLSPQQAASIGSRSPANNNTSQVYLGSSPNLPGAAGVNKSSPDVSVSHPYSGQSSPDAVEFSPVAHSTTHVHETGSAGLSKQQQHEKGLAKSKTQHKFGNFLNRKSSLRGDEQPALPTPSAPLSSSSGRDRPKLHPIKPPTQPIDVPLRTAPVEKERGFRTAMSSALRNRSLDRAEDDRVSSSSSSQHQHASKPSSLGPNSVPSNSHGSVMSNLRSGGTRAAEGINKARKGIFGNFKLNRSGSSHEREPLRNEPYELKVLVLPLEEQARITRIAKRLHYCKDKTEFWLPAFPYRCIDYLSDRGTYSEGLYRVPGSELEIKHYMARFDREHDLDLFDLPDLHDVNVVATMLKRWLSNLPPVFPPDIQTDIIRTCSDSHPAVTGGSTPEYMKQKLSELPPWNYYLLFAITGHISFLHNHRDQNKMTYENLFRCFATRALQVEPYIFWWLVWDWRNCWLGCAKEDEYKAKEYVILDKLADEEEKEQAEAKQPPPPVKKDEKGDAKGEKRTKSSKHSVSAISKQSIPLPKDVTVKQVKSSGEQRPQTSHAHGQSSSRSRSREEKDKAERQKDREREREREKEKERDKDRALSSSDSSKPSITGQSSAGRSASPTTSAGAGTEKDEHEEGGGQQQSQSQGKSQDMGLPMLSPLKPLSPLGLH